MNLLHATETSKYTEYVIEGRYTQYIILNTLQNPKYRATITRMVSNKQVCKLLDAIAEAKARKFIDENT